MAQQCVLKGRINQPISDDALELYILGEVDVRPLHLSSDGSFTLKVDLSDRVKAVLFWKGRMRDAWTCTIWMQPDCKHNIILKTKPNKEDEVEVVFTGDCADLSTYTNLYYQTFESQHLLDSVYLTSFPDFASCQQYIEHTLQPLGDVLLNLKDADFEYQTATQSTEDDTDGTDEEFEVERLSDEAEEQARRSDELMSDEGEELIDEGAVERERKQLDYYAAQAEFTYAMIAERRGQLMDDDEAFQSRLSEIDPNDIDQADVIAFMTAWRVLAHPELYTPLTNEAAQLRCLGNFTESEEVRNATAERIMQHFFFRVQMGQVDPSLPSCRPLYEEFRNVSTSQDYEEFIQAQIEMME